MDKEFGYRSEKSGGPNTNSPNSNATVGGLAALGGSGGGSTSSLKEKQPPVSSSSASYTIGVSQFIDVVSSSTPPVRNYENSTEVNGTYRSRNNNGYDTTADDNVSFSGGGAGRDLTPPLPPLNRQPLSPLGGNGSAKSRPRVDHDEYWRTNI